MELFLLKLAALFLPLASIKYAEAAFDVIRVGLFGVIVAVFVSNSALRKSIVFSAVDAAIFALTLWCLSIYIIYFDKARISEVLKMLIPLLSYTLVKNVVRDSSQYRKLLFWMILGYSIPLIASVLLIATGQGLEYVSYWTGIPRWEGIYTGSHNLGHSMTLFLITLVLYLRLTAENGDAGAVKARTSTYITFGVLAALAIYCLYMAQVRSAILGLLIFATIYLFHFNRRLLFLGATGLVVLAVVTLPYWMPVLLPDVWLVEHGRADVSAIGSGRQTFWLHNIELYASLPIDRQIAGVGLGNRDSFSTDDVIDSHNDWLDVLMQTGLVGVLLLFVLQVVMFRAILRVPGRERYAFLGAFLAVNVMMFVSNSYVWRIQVGHLYYMLMAYIEIRSVRIETERPAMAPLRTA